MYSILKDIHCTYLNPLLLSYSNPLLLCCDDIFISKVNPLCFKKFIVIITIIIEHKTLLLL